jgi:hypothetical protein
LDVLAQGIDVRRLKTEEIGQSNDAMVVNNACCDGLAESKMDKHLTHLLFHAFDNLGRKLREEAKIRKSEESRAEKGRKMFRSTLNAWTQRSRISNITYISAICTMESTNAISVKGYRACPVLNNETYYIHA